DFPTTPGTIHTNYNGGNYDGFVALVNATGTQLLASTFIGTIGNDQVYFVKLDGVGNVYFVGQTTGQYPVQNALYSNPNSGQFISKLTPQLNSVFYSTVFGSGSGSPNISPTAFLVDTCENVYVAGWGTNSSSFTGFANNMFGMPLTNDAIKSSTDGTDFYFIVLSKNADELLYGSYFGGNGAIEHVDGGTSRFDKRGVIYQAMCAGCGGNSLTPTTPGVWAPNNLSTNCNELGLKMEFNLAGTSVELEAFPRATGCVPLNVQFTGTITPGAEFTWYFGDGDTSHQQNPQHLYTDTGTYIVMLVGIDSNSCNISDTAYIDVWVRDDSLSANFAPDIEIDCRTSSVSVASHNYATTSYLWNMGDGTTYTTDSVHHTYANPGNYTITLTVTDTTKCTLSDAFSVPITIQRSVDASFILSDSLGCVPLTINFNAALVNGVSYNWTFGDGTTSNQNSITHTYAQPGTFTAQLIVSDPNSCNLSDTAFSIIEVIDSSAGADFNFTRTFYGCDSVRVNVWSTYIGEEFEMWDFGDGFTSNDDTVSHVYSTGGTYTITHYIRDDEQICKPLDTSYLVISLQPLDINVTVPDTIGCIPFTATFIGNSDLLTTDYFWNFGDGNSAIGDTVTHTYTAVGSYSITVLGQDTNACVFYDSAFAVVNAINDSAIANFGANVLNSCDSNLVVQLTNQSINSVEYHWDFGDGNTSTAVDTTYSYHLPGTYTITLTSIDTNRCHPIDTATFTVTMLPNSYAFFLQSNVCLGDVMQFTNQGSPTAQYTWTFGDGTTSNEFSPSHLYANAGDYNVTLTIIDTTTCDVTSTYTKPVKVYLQPQAGFTVSRDTFKFETPVEFVNTSTNYEHLMWDFGDGQGVLDEEAPIHVYGKIYQMTVCLNAFNAACSDTFCKTIFISFDALIGVPNAFSPNGDGVNDVIRIEGKGITELEFRIYNRWGEKVFETNSKAIGWDGYYKGVLQEMEVYTYSVQASFVDGSSKQLKGNITLLR
ncbi:MAG: PKD domain-containing protein, partial [Bacteroidetes bacterium]|nr:PKD domain-containing protein [Bacteroidota bacterium]